MKKNIIAATLSAAMVVGSVPFAGAASAVVAVPTRDKGQAVTVTTPAYMHPATILRTTIF